MSPRLLTILSVLGTLSLISIPAREAQLPNRHSAGVRVAGEARRPASAFERNAMGSERARCTAAPVQVRATPVADALTLRLDDEGGRSAPGSAPDVVSSPCAGAWTLVAAGPPGR